MATKTKTTRTKSTKTIIAKLDALCQDVMDNTQQATQAIDTSDKKLLAFMEKFALDACKNYSGIVQKYCTISGYEDLSLEAQHESTAAGTANHLYLKFKVDWHSGTMLVSLVWHHYQDTKLLEVRANTEWGSNPITSYPNMSETDLYREKLALAVQYIKSGKFDKDFVNTVNWACKNRLAKNAQLTATAAVHNQI